jgi:hypothetical protein
MVNSPRYAFRTSRSGEVPVMAGPGDEMAAGAGGRSHLRASHADREQVIGTLKAAFVQGMLAKDELDERVGQVFASRTHGELASLTADLPAGLSAAPPPGTPARVWPRPPLGKVVAGAALIVPPPAMAGLAFLTGSREVAIAAALVVVIFFMAWMVAGAQLLANWHDKRTRRRLPPGPAPGAGGQASRPLPSAGPGRQLPQAGHGHRHTAEAVPIGRPRLLPS